MRPGDDPKDAADELRVIDRRRFTSTGDIREDEAAVQASQAPDSQGSPSAPGSASASTAPPRSGSDEAPLSEPGSTQGLPGGADLAEPGPAEPGPAEPGPAQTAMRGEALHDLGIESVFLIFHQSALIALGATHPDGPPGRVDLAEARQAITFLKVLEEKTRGNLDADEAAMLQDLLSESQMAYVQVARSMPGGRA